jgi:hypothetical protein
MEHPRLPQVMEPQILPQAMEPQILPQVMEPLKWQATEPPKEQLKEPG